MSFWKSLCASWVSRSNCLFFSSMARERLTRSASVNLCALCLQLLGQGVDLVAEALDLLAPGIVLLLQVGEIALELVGLGDRGLKGDDRDLGGTGGRARRQAFARLVRKLFDRRPERLDATTNKRTNKGRRFMRINNSFGVPACRSSSALVG